MSGWRHDGWLTPEEFQDLMRDGGEAGLLPAFSDDTGVMWVPRERLRDYGVTPPEGGRDD